MVTTYFVKAADFIEQIGTLRRNKFFLLFGMTADRHYEKK